MPDERLESYDHAARTMFWLGACILTMLNSMSVQCNRYIGDRLPRESPRNPPRRIVHRTGKVRAFYVRQTSPQRRSDCNSTLFAVARLQDHALQAFRAGALADESRFWLTISRSPRSTVDRDECTDVATIVSNSVSTHCCRRSLQDLQCLFRPARPHRAALRTTRPPIIQITPIAMRPRRISSLVGKVGCQRPNHVSTMTCICLPARQQVRKAGKRGGTCYAARLKSRRFQQPT